MRLPEERPDGGRGGCETDGGIAMFPTAARPAALGMECILFPRPPRRSARMPNTFDPYREALVVESHTVWPAEYEDWSAADKARAEALLHAAPQEAAELDYVRQHTGFARVITVTAADLDRVSGR